MINEEQFQQIRKSSRRTALVSILGVLIVIVALVYSSMKLTSLNKVTAEKKHEIDSLETRKAALLAVNDSLKGIVQHLDSTLATPITERKPPPPMSSVKPRAEAKAVEGLKGYKDLQVYDFSLWLEAPPAVRQRIQQVTYEFNHPSFRLKQQVSANPTDGFRVSYRGWGCLHIVTITITMRNGDTHRLDFDMCEALGVGE